MMTKNEVSNYIIPQDDDRDSVCYGKDKIKSYWNPETAKYKIFERKANTAIWQDIDYHALMGKWADVGRLLVLMQSCDRDNMLCVRKANTRSLIPICGEQQLMQMLDLKDRAWRSFKARLDTANIIKYVTIQGGDDSSYMRYFINPLITMRVREISPMCYKLFKEDLDAVLSSTARHNLQRHCDEMLTEPAVDEIAAQSEKEKQDIFNEYILHGKPAKTYQKLGTGMVAHPTTTNNDTYFIVNKTTEYKAIKPKNVDITGYNAWYIDIDAGKDEDGNYFSLEEVSRRKQYIRRAIDALPIPTVIVDTRNGYHAYYACYGVDTAASWQKLEDKLISIVMIADPAVRDAARVLRLPGSNWIKSHTGLEPYPVTIQQANRQAYDVESFQQQLDTCADKVQEAAQTYIDMYPAPHKTSSKMAAIALHVANISERIQAIADLSSDTFAIPESQDVGDIKAYLHHEVNLAEFLQIENPSSFCCILHDDHHPSATIYENETGYRYLCGFSSCVGNGDGKGLDIIDIVQALSGCSYTGAINYLTKLYCIRRAA